MRGCVWFKHQTGRVTRKRGKRAQDLIREHGSTRESKHLCRRHAHTGNRGGRQAPGSEKHKTVTFRLHQEQDFLIFQAWSVEYYPGSLFVTLEALRREHEWAISSRKKRASRSWLLTGQRIDHDSGSLLGQWSVGDQWALTGWRMCVSRTGAECSWAAIDWAVILALWNKKNNK